MNIEIIRAKVAQLDREGITPLDLFSWTHLLDLRARYKAFAGIDLAIHHDMQESINNALWKKARMMDAHDKTSFHIDLLVAMDIPALTRS